MLLFKLKVLSSNSYRCWKVEFFAFPYNYWPYSGYVSSATYTIVVKESLFYATQIISIFCLYFYIYTCILATKVQ